MQVKNWSNDPGLNAINGCLPGLHESTKVVIFKVTSVDQLINQTSIFGMLYVICSECLEYLQGERKQQ